MQISLHIQGNKRQAGEHLGVSVQATFFIALAVASRLGTAALAAHQIVAQLWLLTSYVTDGFAVAGTVLGSRLSHQRHASADSNQARYTALVTYMSTCVWSEQRMSIHRRRHSAS